MKKHLAQGLLIAFIVTSVFVSNAFIKVTPVTASSMKNCELINLLITIGVLPANRADQARAAFNCSASDTITIATSTLTYNGNGSTGGTVPVNNGSYLFGATTTVANNTGGLVKTGYIFTGWNTRDRGEGNFYATSSVLTFSIRNITLYAAWERVLPINTYSLVYRSNDAATGTVPVNSNTFTTGATTTIVGNTGNLAKTNHIFSGWNTRDDGFGIDYASSSILTFGSSNVKLFARFTSTARPCVDYNYTGYSACVNGNQTRTVSTQSPASCVGGATPVLSRTCNTAVYKIIYNKNDAATGTAPVNSNLFSLGATTTVAANTGGLARNNHTFAGWNTKENGTGIEYAPGSVITFGSADIKLFARWARVAN
jgi:uncharacterized repeat protein (TIGR02543 family)